MSSRRRAAVGLARAWVRLPWSLGLWGAQQVVSIWLPHQAGRQEQQVRQEQSVHRLCQVAEESLSGPIRDLHRTGVHLQEGFLDSTASLLSGSWREPRAAIDEAWKTLDRTWDLFTDPEGKRR